jgi:hypothetical protein
MLLRSITRHVSDQNWVAVFIDFVIVVVGVFIGLQVSNWNDARLLDLRSRGLYERLATNFGADVWVATNLHNYHQQVLEDALLVLNEIN